jgi:hypothetical protein
MPDSARACTMQVTNMLQHDVANLAFVPHSSTGKPLYNTDDIQGTKVTHLIE